MSEAKRELSRPAGANDRAAMAANNKAPVAGRYGILKDVYVDAQIHIYIHTYLQVEVEQECRMICAGVPSFFGLELQDGHSNNCQQKGPMCPR